MTTDTPLLRLLAQAHPERSPGDLVAMLETIPDRETPRRPTIFPPRRPVPSYDRIAARLRRRAAARDRWLPDHLAHHFTDGELAALSVVAEEHMKHGACDLPVAKIATFAGVCDRTVRYGLRRAESMGIIAVKRERPKGQKNLPNDVTIIDRTWLRWIERRPARYRLQRNADLTPKRKNLPLTPWNRQAPLRRENRSERLPEGRVRERAEPG